MRASKAHPGVQGELLKAALHVILDRQDRVAGTYEPERAAQNELQLDAVCRAYVLSMGMPSDWPQELTDAIENAISDAQAGQLDHGVQAEAVLKAIEEWLS